MRTVLLGASAAVIGVALAAGAPQRTWASPGPSPAPSAQAEAPPAEPGVRPAPLELDALRNVLASMPVLAELAAQFEPFSTADIDAALRRGGRSRQSIHVWTFMPAVFVWQPRQGRELLVVSGRSGERALIAVLEAKGPKRYEHAASLTLREPEATLAIGYSEDHREQLVWSSCYGCAGEGGTIRSLDDGRIEFGYR